MKPDFSHFSYSNWDLKYYTWWFKTNNILKIRTFAPKDILKLTFQTHPDCHLGRRYQVPCQTCWPVQSRCPPQPTLLCAGPSLLLSVALALAWAPPTFLPLSLLACPSASELIVHHPNSLSIFIPCQKLTLKSVECLKGRWPLSSLQP